MTGIILTIVSILIVFLTVIITAVMIAGEKEKNIYENGLEVESIVVRCEHYFTSDHDSRYHCYVKYEGNDGLYHEGLLNVRTDLPVGRKIRIRYLPEKYNEVVFVSQKL